MEKMEKPLSNSPFSPFSMNFDHRMTYVAAYLGTLTCLFSHTRLLKGAGGGGGGGVFIKILSKLI